MGRSAEDPGPAEVLVLATARGYWEDVFVDTSFLSQLVAPLCTLVGVVATLVFTDMQSRKRAEVEREYREEDRKREADSLRAKEDGSTAELFFGKVQQLGSIFTQDGPGFAEDWFSEEYGAFRIRVREHLALRGSGDVRAKVMQIVDELPNAIEHAAQNGKSEFDQLVEMLELAADLAAASARGELDGEVQDEFARFSEDCARLPAAG